MGDKEVWVQQMLITSQMVLPPGTMVLSGVVLAECPGGLRTTYSGEPYWLAWCEPEGLPEGHYLIPREVSDG